MRTLTGNAGTAATIVVSLAPGIGANTTIFAVANALLMRPLPIPDPPRVVVLSRGDGGEAALYPDYLDHRDRAAAFEGLAAFTAVPLSFGTGTENDVVRGEMVSGNYFATLGVSARAGRALVPRTIARQEGTRLRS